MGTSLRFLKAVFCGMAQWFYDLPVKAHAFLGSRRLLVTVAFLAGTVFGLLSGTLAHFLTENRRIASMVAWCQRGIPPVADIPGDSAWFLIGVVVGVSVVLAGLIHRRKRALSQDGMDDVIRSLSSFLNGPVRRSPK